MQPTRVQLQQLLDRVAPGMALTPDGQLPAMAGGEGRPTNEPTNYFAIGLQEKKGEESEAFYFYKHLDGTGLELDEQTESVHEGGDGQEVGFVHRTALSLDGDVIHNARPESVARAAAWTLGADTSAEGTGTATPLSIHTAVPTSTLPYLTVEQYFADNIERGVDAQFTSMVVEGEAGRPLKISHSLVTGGTPYKRDVEEALEASRETDQPFFYPGGSYQLTGASGAKLTKFKAEVKRNLDTDIRTTQLFREDVVGLTFESMLEGTLKYEDSELFDLVRYQGEGGTTINPNALGLATGAFRAYTEFGSGTTQRYFDWSQPLITFTGVKVNKLDPDGKTMYIDFSAMGVKSATHQVIVETQTPESEAFV